MAARHHVIVVWSSVSESACTLQDLLTLWAGPVLLSRCPAVHDVAAGQIAIDVSFAGTPIYEEVDDLCSKTTCPIKTGPLDIKYIQDLPPIAPPVSPWPSTSNISCHHPVQHRTSCECCVCNSSLPACLPWQQRNSSCMPAVHGRFLWW